MRRRRGVVGEPSEHEGSLSPPSTDRESAGELRLTDADRTTTTRLEAFTQLFNSKHIGQRPDHRGRLRLASGKADDRSRYLLYLWESRGASHSVGFAALLLFDHSFRLCLRLGAVAAAMILAWFLFPAEARSSLLMILADWLS